MTQKKKHKICLVSERLASGGAERCAALLSQFFERNNIEVHHVVVLDEINYAYSGELLNLGLYKNKSNGFLNKLKRFRVLKKYLRDHSFDYIIDFRVKNNQFQEYIMTRLLYKSPYIMTIHHFLTDYYFPKWDFLAKKIYNDAAGIVTVSTKIQEKVMDKYCYKNVDTIYNPIDIDEIHSLSQKGESLKYDYVIAIGRMEDNIKQFDKLITAYHNSVLPSRNIDLVLLGDGAYRDKLEKQAASLGLKNQVKFLGWLENPFSYMKNAKFMALSSKNEGFGNVLIESLACETPVVSFDCLSGPSEIIKDRYNGLLVENQNTEKLTEAMNLMVEDSELYQDCKRNSLESVRRFSLENIGKQWLDYLKIKTNE